MTVAQIITQSQRVLGDNTGRATLLLLLDSLVKDLYDGATDKQMEYFDPTTGRHPFLVTTAEDRQYDYPSWAKYILNVYDADIADEYTNVFPPYPVTCDNTKREITFAFDPGSESQQYKLRGIYGPTAMSSENDSLCLVPTNSRYPLLVVGLVSAVQPDRRGYNIERWEKLKEEFRVKIRIGRTPIKDQVNLKTEYQAGYGVQTRDYYKRV